MSANKSDRQTYPSATHGNRHALPQNAIPRAATSVTHESSSLDHLEQLVEEHYLRNLMTEMMPRPSPPAY